MTEFRIGFEGPAVDDGEIDVEDFAPALLALGEFFAAANSAINQTRADAKLRIRATEKGSFVALLALDISFIADMLDLVSAHPDRITAADQLLDLTFKGAKSVGAIGAVCASFFGALKFLKGRRPDNAQKLPDGNTQITINDATIIIDPRTATLLEDLPTREAAEKFVKKSLAPKGISAVYLDEDGKAGPNGEMDVVFTEDDIEAISIPDDDEDEAQETTLQREALLKIVSAQFQDGYLWRFTDGANTFTASMEDEKFADRINRSEVVLSKDDTLRCVIEETQQLKGSKLKTEAKIVEVKEHISGARQLKLF